MRPIMKDNNSIIGLTATLTLGMMISACSGEANNTQQPAQDTAEAETAASGPNPANSTTSSTPAAEVDPVEAAAEKAMKAAENRLDGKANTSETGNEKSPQ